MCPQKEKKGSLSRGSRDRLANLAVKSSQSMGNNRECGIVWIVMNNTGLGLQGLLLNSRASSLMFSECDYFISYTKTHNGQSVTVGGLNHTSVVSYGSVFFCAKLLSGQITLVIL